MRYVDAVGLWCALGYAALAVLARQAGEPDLPAFFLLVAWTGLPVFGLHLYFRWSGRRFPVGRLILWAVVFRICGLAGGPFYEDDFYRYLWDAYRFATTGTPYGVAPEEFFVDPGVPELFQRVLDGINYPELPTIYGPTTQLVFLLGYAVQPASVTVLQAILIAVDLVTVCLGLAAGAKTFGLVLAPLVLARARARHWILFGGTLAALYAPFALRGGTDLASLQVFAREWEFNSALFGLLAAVAPRFESRLALGLLFAAFWAYYNFVYSRRGAHPVPRGDWIYGALLAASPVINPWYLLWLLPFAAVFPSVWAWTASVAILLGYVTGLNLHDYEMHPYAQPLWARGLEFGLILAGMGCDLVRRLRPAIGVRVDGGG